MKKAMWMKFLSSISKIQNLLDQFLQNYEDKWGRLAIMQFVHVNTQLKHTFGAPLKGPAWR
jgi:hypothetical protein